MSKDAVRFWHSHGQSLKSLYKSATPWRRRHRAEPQLPSDEIRNTHERPSSQSGVDACGVGDDAIPPLVRLLFFAIYNLCSSAQKEGRPVRAFAGEKLLQSLAKLLESYLREHHGDGGDGRGRAGFSALSTAPFGSAQSPTNNQGSKRSRGKDEPPNGGKRPRHETSSRASEVEERLRWACPFYLSDKSKYWSCLSLHLARVSDVRQHICRRHLQVSHCPTCGEIFEHDVQGSLRSDHIVRRECSRAQFSYPGATPDQWKALCSNTRNDALPTDMKSNEARWYYMWQVLFPTAERPDTPYITSSDFVEILDGIRTQFFSPENLHAVARHLLLPEDYAEFELHMIASIRASVDQFFHYATEHDPTHQLHTVIGRESAASANLLESSLVPQAQTNQLQLLTPSSGGIDWPPRTNPNPHASSLESRQPGGARWSTSLEPATSPWASNASVNNSYTMPETPCPQPQASTGSTAGSQAAPENGAASDFLRQ